MLTTARQGITPHMTSHSIRRESAAYANASHKLSIQWISTRGAWLLESLTKVLAYIGTTTKEDQSVGKVLAGYNQPDLPVLTPSIRHLRDRLSVVEYGLLLTLCDELFRYVLGLPDPRYNVALEVVDAVFASLLMHLSDVMKVTLTSNTSQAHVDRYLYELERAIAATNQRLASSVTLDKCCSWGEHMKIRWLTANHAHVSIVATAGDTKLTSVLESMLKQLTVMADRLARVEDAQAKLLARSVAVAPGSPLRDEQPITYSSAASLFATAPPQATATTLAGCFLNWYTNHIWETVKGKKEQNERAEAKAAVNMMVILYQEPLEIPAQPSKAEASAYQAWKHALWNLALKMDSSANQRLHTFDSKKATSKASSLRKRWRQLRTTHPDAYKSLGAQYLTLKADGSIIDFCTPVSHQWATGDLA